MPMGQAAAPGFLSAAARRDPLGDADLTAPRPRGKAARAGKKSKGGGGRTTPPYCDGTGRGLE